MRSRSDAPSVVEPLVPLFFETYSTTNDFVGSPFGRLPREIRDQIYDDLLSTFCFQYEEGSLQVDLDYRGKNETTLKCLPQWLLISKAVLRESLEQFYLHAVCTHFQGRDRISQHSKSHFKLLSLRHVRKLEMVGSSMRLWFRARNRNTEAAYKMFILPSLDTQETFRSTLQSHLKNREHKIKDLTLRFDFPSWNRFPEVMETPALAADFQLLQGLGASFERVEFILDGPAGTWSKNDDGEFHIIRNIAVAYRMVQLEFENTGKFLVGTTDQGAGCVVRDWMDDQTPGAWHIEFRRTSDGRVEGGIQYLGLQYWEDDASGVLKFARVPVEDSAGRATFQSTSGFPDELVVVEEIFDFTEG